MGLTEKEAKDMVRLYGHRKQFLSLEDMKAMNNRWNSSKSPVKAKANRVVGR